MISIATITLGQLVAGSGRRPPHQTRHQSLIFLVFASRLSCGTAGHAQIFTAIRARGIRPAVSNVATLSARGAEGGLLVVSSSTDIDGSVLNDTIVQKNCSLHIRGNLLGSLTIEFGAKVVIEGSVGGKITNRGGRLVVNHKGLAACVTSDGPAEAEACGVLKISLAAIASNWDKLAKYTEAECAAMVKANAYGCGIEPVAGALAKTGCRTFFVSNIPEAKRVRAVAPNSTIYVLSGLYPGTSASGEDRGHVTHVTNIAGASRGRLCRSWRVQ